MLKIKQKTKIACLLTAIAMLVMVPVYHFTIMNKFEGNNWTPIWFFSTFGISCLINFFIMEMEQVKNNWHK